MNSILNWAVSPSWAWARTDDIVSSYLVIL